MAPALVRSKSPVVGWLTTQMALFMPYSFLKSGELYGWLGTGELYGWLGTLYGVALPQFFLHTVCNISTVNRALRYKALHRG